MKIDFSFMMIEFTGDFFKKNHLKHQNNIELTLWFENKNFIANICNKVDKPPTDKPV